MMVSTAVEIQSMSPFFSDSTSSVLHQIPKEFKQSLVTPTNNSEA